MEHYYTQKPTSSDRERTIVFELRDVKCSFLTSDGVFSKRRIDQGSQFLLNTLCEEKVPSGNILDLGCGYGFLGIVLAIVQPQCEVIMVDSNERATSLAAQNAVFNNVQQRVNVLAGNGFMPLPAAKRFSLMVSNPPIRAGKDLLCYWFAQAPHYLTADGSFWLVLRKKQGALSFKKILQRFFSQVHCVAKYKGYYIFRAMN